METKPGYKTSELASLAAYALLVAINKRLGLDIDPNVLMALGGAVGAYVVSRGWAKRPA